MHATTERRGVRSDWRNGTLRVVGAVDLGSVGDLRLALNTAVDTAGPAGSIDPSPGTASRAGGSGDRGEVVVDVSGLVLRDATGLGALLAAHHRALHAGRRLVLVGVREPLAVLFLRTRLYRVLRYELAVQPGPSQVAADLLVGPGRVTAADRQPEDSGAAEVLVPHARPPYGETPDRLEVAL